MVLLKPVALCLFLSNVFATVNSAHIETEDIDEQGLYRKSDNVVILTSQNFQRNVYRQSHALVVQFYNTYCGHCRAFAPKYKELAADIVAWSPVIQLAVMDCSVEDNSAVCRDFEVMAYPTIRYIHENFKPGNGLFGESLSAIDSAENLKHVLIKTMQLEQTLHRMSMIPSLSIASYNTYIEALKDVPNNIEYTFLVFENVNSTIGSELLLDTNDYSYVRIKRVYDSSVLAANQRVFPALVAVKQNLEATSLTPSSPTRQNLLHAINTYLTTKNYVFPIREYTNENKDIVDEAPEKTVDEDVVFYSDIEKALRTALFIEIPRRRVLSGESLEAAINFLNTIINSFPFIRGNGKSFVTALRDTMETKDSWTGEEITALLKSLEHNHSPVFTPNLEYVGCKGSQIQYRGYTCGLWTMFHSLTVNAAKVPGNEGMNVLRSMYGYVKHFFGCSECQEHFIEMAARNRIFDITENDKAILWLWVAHNEVNLRLAKDPTEDPMHPKIQFPRVSRCPSCRVGRGAWHLPAVLRYVTNMYSAEAVRDDRAVARGANFAAPSPFSNLDLGMLSLLYIICLLFLIFLIKFLLAKRFYRKRIYKHDGWGKV